MAATFTMTQTPNTNPQDRRFTVVWIGPDQGVIYDVALRIARNWEHFSEAAHDVRGHPGHKAVSYIVGRTDFDLFIKEIEGVWHFEGCSGTIAKAGAESTGAGELWELDGEGDPVDLTMFGALDPDFKPESLQTAGSSVAKGFTA